VLLRGIIHWLAAAQRLEGLLVVEVSAQSVQRNVALVMANTIWIARGSMGFLELLHFFLVK
jgi:hypothetical protein